METLHDMTESLRRQRFLRATTTLLVSVSVMLVSACAASSSAGAGKGSSHQSATAAARSFLSRYVDGDGRVARHDQGDDTVSEGQGYALLLSVAIGDSARFATVWRWTRENLQQPTGALAFHWANGHVVDTTPAADADLQTAWALSLAATRFHNSSYSAAAKRIAAATVTQDVGYDDTGAPTLGAGPWAVRSGSPTTVEPGYWTWPAEQAMAQLTGDKRWHDLPAADLAHLKALTGNGSSLPADWAQVGQGQPPHAVGGPQSAPLQSGPDGMRAMVWATCTPGGVPLAAKWWHLMSSSASAAPLSRDLSGASTSSDPAALSAVAAAAAAMAAGDDAQRDTLLDRATSIDRQFPTYYGAAWVALGRILLTTDRLGHC
jgi:endo-1,4-beta-D-glucanase Y